MMLLFHLNELEISWKGEIKLLTLCDLNQDILEISMSCSKTTLSYKSYIHWFENDLFIKLFIYSYYVFEDLSFSQPTVVHIKDL